MLVFLILFTLGSLSAFTYCALTPSIPVIGTALFLCLTLLLTAVTLIAFRDAIRNQA